MVLFKEPVLKLKKVPDMKLFTYEFKKNKPKYQELASYIANEIKNKQIKTNEALPSKRILASHLGVSINTIINAYNILLDEGYIFSVPKKGYFVANLNIETKPIKRKESSLPVLQDQIIYNFTTSDVDSTLTPASTLKKIYNEVLNDSSYLRKGDFKGETSLREAIRNYLYEVKGIEVSIEQIIISSGIDTLLSQIIEITNSNIIAVENPGYQKISNLLLSANKRVIYTPVDDNGMTIPNDKVDLIYQTPYSQFPLGIKMTLDRKNEFINYVNKNNSYIIEDSFDSDFKLTPGITRSMFSMSNKVIYLESFSRSIAPSFRISFMVLPLELLHTYEKRYRYFSNPVSTITQLVICEYIKSGQYLSHINKMRTSYRKKRKLIIEQLDKNKFEIISSESYLAIIVRPHNIPANWQSICNKYKLRIHFISDFMVNGISDLLMIGYSSIPIEKIKDGINILNSIF